MSNIDKEESSGWLRDSNTHVNSNQADRVGGLKQMLRVQSRLHKASGANALALTFLNAANRISELESDKLNLKIEVGLVNQTLDNLKSRPKKYEWFANGAAGEVTPLKARISELESLCKECADYLDTNEHTSIHNDSYLHRELRKNGGES